ncbi:hypothetical protein QM027_07055 [Campylobacter concisus]
MTLFRNEFKDKILDTDGSNVNQISAFGACPAGLTVKKVGCPGWELTLTLRVRPFGVWS